MNTLPKPDTTLPPAVRRMMAISPLSEAAVGGLVEASRQARAAKPRREVLREGAPIHETLMMLSGWAARIRQLEDGRRQIMSFLLPGDMIGNCRQSNPLSVSTVVALTAVEFCAVPVAERGDVSLREAYAVSAALEEAHLLAQITRLGRLNAEERLADLMLELLQRLALAGLAQQNAFRFPLTQETLADATGLSCVHLNRTLQTLRRQGDIVFKSGYLSLHDPVQLARRVGQINSRVCDVPANRPS